MSSSARKLRLLWFNLATDVDDPVLGFTTAWINAVAARCESIDVITMRTGSLAVADNVRVFSVGKELGYSEPRRLIEFYRVLSRLLAEHRYDACFAHMMPLFAILGYPLLKRRAIPITMWYTHKSVTLILRLAEKLVKRVVTASPDSFRIKSPKVMVLGHGIDTNAFTPSSVRGRSKQPFTVISVGRIAPIKRLEVLIEAIRSLPERAKAGLEVRLIGGVLPGNEDYATQLHDLVKTYNLESIVSFVGPIRFEEIVSENQRADVMVSLTGAGSFDKAILEAMSCGLPVVTSNEAFRSVLGDLADVLLIPTAGPEDLASRLNDLMSMPVSQRLRLGQQLRREIETNHDLSKLAALLISCFTSDSPPD